MVAIQVLISQSTPAVLSCALQGASVSPDEITTMMTAKDFYDGTEIKWCGRGSDLKAIDARLGAAELNPTAANLIAVYTAACAWGWRKAKKHGDKRTENFSLRLQKVQVLVQEVEQQLGLLGLDVPSLRKAVLSYEKKKMSGKKGGLRSLGKGYSHERKEFLNTKRGGVSKDQAIAPKAGSLVGEVLKATGAAKLKAVKASDGTVADLASNRGGVNLLTRVHGKEIKQISSSEYEDIVAMVEAGEYMGMVSQKSEVNFVRKTDRVSKFLAWCENGLFYKQNGIPHTSTGHELYAMDKYGSLITMPVGLFFNKTTRVYDGTGDAQHNHSSLNAGGDVICAGEIEFLNGKITYISNESGHYKPKARQLQNCVNSLNLADEADLTLCKVNVWTGKDMKLYNDPAQFLAAKF